MFRLSKHWFFSFQKLWLTFHCRAVHVSAKAHGLIWVTERVKGWIIRDPIMFAADADQADTEAALSEVYDEINP